MRLIKERRRKDFAGPPPSLRAALRQLRVRVIDAHGATGRAAFVARLLGTSLLANIQGHGPVGDMLMGLARKIQNNGAGDHRELMYEALDNAELTLHQRT